MHLKIIYLVLFMLQIIERNTVVGDVYMLLCSVAM